MKLPRNRHVKETACLLVLVGWLAIQLPSFFRMWIPHDEGALSQSADRVLHGQIPHVDFQEIYSGGLTLLHAFSFQVLGVRLQSLRTVHVVFFFLAMVVYQRICRRWVDAAPATLLTILATIWSSINYPASMPSWYNLYFGIVGLYFLMKFTETNKRMYIFLGGILGGLSCLIKITGIYFLAGAGLFLLWSNHSPSRTIRRSPKPGIRLPGLLAAAIAGVGYPILFLLIIGRRLSLMTLFHFVLPIMILGGITAVRACRYRRIIPSPFLLLLSGAAITLIPAIAFYAQNGRLGALWEGLFRLPQWRYYYAFFSLPPVSTLLVLVPGAAVVTWSSIRRRPPARPLLAVIAIVLTLLLSLGYLPFIYSCWWWGLRPLISVACLMFAAGLATNRIAFSETPDLSRDQAMLVLCVSAPMNFVQYPYSYGIYFYYIAPLALLSLTAVVKCRYQRIWPATALYLAALGGFGLLWVNRSDVRSAGIYYAPDTSAVRLLPKKANLLVSRGLASVYTNLTEFIQQRTGEGEAIYAGPDCPEIVFLSGRSNPFPEMYEFFNGPDWGRELPRRLEAAGISLVVINRYPEFSAPLSAEAGRELARRYPAVADFGPFRVYDKQQRTRADDPDRAGIATTD